MEAVAEKGARDGINLHIVRNVVSHDSRVLKETGTLANSGRFHRIEICGFLEQGHRERETLDGRSVWRVPLTTRPLFKGLVSQSIKYAEWYGRVVSRYRREPLNVIHCHALGPLPIAVRLKSLTGARLVYDAHELETETYEKKGLRKAIARLAERRLMSAVDVMITVSPSIRTWYAERFPRASIKLVRNVPVRPSGHLVSQQLRRRLGVPDDALLFIYVGALRWGKGIEPTLAAFQTPQVRHHLLCLGQGPLQPSVEAATRKCDRIHHLPPVPPSEVLSYVSGADVSICMTQDSCLSRRYSLPNKLFESLVAGVPVVVSPLPDLKELVERYKAGWVLPQEPDALCNFIAQLSVADVRGLSADMRCRVADLQWSNEAKELLAAYDLLGL